MICFVRYDKGLGNAALRLRAVDSVGAFTDLGFLTEVPDADPLESNYIATVTPPAGWIVIQFVRVSDGLVVAEHPDGVFVAVPPLAVPNVGIIAARTLPVEIV